MKYFLTSLLIIVFHCSYGQTMQQQKIGHADWEYIFSRMPDYKKIETELKTFERQLQNQLESKTQELEVKYKAYRGLASDTPEAIRRDKESELTYLQENLQKFTQEAQVAIQKKQTDLVNPVLVKVGKAIEEVAIENEYTYIINPQMMGGGDVLLYSNERFNISDLVLKKLGIALSQAETGPVEK